MPNLNSNRGRVFTFLQTSAILFGLMAHTASSQDANYDEAKVPDFELPPSLVMEDGSTVDTSGEWLLKRRPELLGMFENHVYGIAPGRPQGLRFETLSDNPNALNGAGTRREIRITATQGDRSHSFDLLVYRPNSVKTPVPAFLGLNFRGNHTVTEDPGVAIPEAWVPNDERLGATNNHASAEGRGKQSSRWPIEAILQRGYAVATIYCGAIDPDYHDGFQNGVHALFAESRNAHSWGTVAAWAWGLSRGLDYLQSDPSIDGSKVAVIGHSRLGKTALWAGAVDTRFGLVISNNSGCGGAALSRREFGETVRRINQSFPHWFNDQYKTYSDRIQESPVDQHQLIALMAPRPVYIASATEDRWADPKGEFLSGKYASDVYALFGLQGLMADTPPAPDTSIGASIGYHARTGRHNIAAFDWDRYMDFADRHWR